MVLTTAKLLKLAEDQNFKWCKIYTPTRELFSCYNNEKQTNSELIKALSDFAANYHGQWHIHFKTGGTVVADNLCKVDVVFGPQIENTIVQTPIQGIAPQQQPLKQVDEDAIEKRIRKQLDLEYQLKENNKLISDLQKQVERTNDSGNNFGNLLGLLVNKFGAPAPAMKIAGAPGMQGEPIEPAEREKWKNGVELLMKHTNGDFFLALAKKIDSQPDLLNQAKIAFNIQVP